MSICGIEINEINTEKLKLVIEMAAIDNLWKQKFAADVFVGKFYSVEFNVDGIKYSYQFKLWNGYSGKSFVLVKENSKIIRRLHAGDVFNMKYHSINSNSPSELIDTEITDITRENNGRFKGHYLVNLCPITTAL